MTSPKISLSQNGWPASADPTQIDARNFMIPGTNQHLKLASRGAPLLLAAAAEFNKTIEPINAPGSVFDDWGYSVGDDRGIAAMLSNHASGTAMDLNATKHPFGKVGTYPTAKVPLIKAIAAKYGLRWGGSYVGSPVDEMHFEINISPAAADLLIKKLSLPAPVAL